MTESLVYEVSARLRKAEKKLRRLDYISSMPVPYRDRLLTELVLHHREKRDSMAYFIEKFDKEAEETSRLILLNNVERVRDRTVDDVMALQELKSYLEPHEIVYTEGVTDANLV